MRLTFEEQEAMLYFFHPGESICVNYLEFLHREICLFSPLVYLSNHLLTVWICGCLSYALVYNPILLYLFSAQIAPALGVVIFSVGLHVPLIYSHCFGRICNFFQLRLYLRAF